MTDPAAFAVTPRARRAWLAALGVPLAVAVALWAVDGVALALAGVARGALGQALVVTFPLAAVGGIAVGVVAALLCALAWIDADPQRPSLGMRVRAWLFQGEPRDHASRIASVLALLTTVALCAYLAYQVTHSIVIDMAQPHFIALSVVAAHFVISVLGALLVWPLRNGAQALVSRWQALPVLVGLLSSVARLLLALAVLALVAGVVVATRSSFALSYLPWDSIGKVALALVLGIVVHRGYARLPKLMRRVVLSSVAALSAASVAVATVWGVDANAGRVLSEEQTVTGAFGYRVLRAMIDYDNDGHLHVLGGGDCAPHDPAIHPGATDLPENHIDEDCDGEDLTARMVDNPSGYRFVVPNDWAERPPIVLITVDAFAATRMAAFGSTQKITPRIDAFADNAMLFRSCFAQGPSTRLSFPSMFTSRWDSQIAQRLEGKHPYPIEESEVTIAEVLQRVGYDTAAVLPDGYFDPGRWQGITSGFRNVDTSAYRKQHLAHNATVVTDAAIATIKKTRDRPLFLWVHYYDAHSPHEQPKGVAARGTDVSAVYDAELSFVDGEVGRLIDHLDQGVGSDRQRPLIVLTADHGIDFNTVHHAKFNYGYDLYTSVLHVPLIVRMPGAPRGRYEHLVSTMDIAPTLVNVLRLKDRFPFQGVSLVRELSSGFATESRRLIHQFFIFENYWKALDPLEKISLRTERYNLIHDRKRGAYELYDWKADYFEAQDLSADPDAAAVFKDLRKQLSFFTYSLHRRPPPVPREPARRRR